MIELAGSTVQAWECDVMGHLNIQLYIERALDGVAVLATRMGIGPMRLAAQGTVLEAVDQHMRLLRELRSGAIYFIRGGLVSLDQTRLHAYCEIVNRQTNVVSATVRTECRLKRIDTQGDAPFDDKVVEAAAAFLAEIPAHGRPRGMTLNPPRPALTLAEAEALGMIPTFSGVTRPQECDQYGYMQPRFFTGCIINAISHLLQPRNVSVEVETLGGAAIENRIVYRLYPRAGDVLTIRSAISAIGDKTYEWMHSLFNYETGLMLASSKSVAIPMDLEKRKSIPIPDFFRARLASHLVAGLEI